MLHRKMQVCLASNPRGAECLAARGWPVASRGEVAHMCREECHDTLFGIASELVPTKTADVYVEWLLTLFSKMAEQVPIAETHKDTTVVALFWVWRQEVQPAPEFTPGYVLRPPDASDASLADTSASSGGSGAASAPGFDLLAAAAAEAAAREESEAAAAAFSTPLSVKVSADSLRRAGRII